MARLKILFTILFLIFNISFIWASGLEIMGEGALYYHQETTEGNLRNPIGGLNPAEVQKVHGYLNPVFKYTYGSLIYSEIGVRLENPDFLKLSEPGSMFNPDYGRASILHPPHLFIEKFRIKDSVLNKKINFAVGLWNYKELFFTPYTVHKWWYSSFFLDIQYGFLKVRGIQGENSNPYVTIADKVSLMLPIRKSDFRSVHISYNYNKINELGVTFVKQGSGLGNIMSINWNYFNNKNFFDIASEVANENKKIATYLDIDKTMKNVSFKGEFFSIDKDYNASAGVDDKDDKWSWFPDAFSAGRVTFVDLNKNHEPDYPFDYNMERISYIGIYVNDVDPIVGEDINHNGVVDSVENDKYPEYKYKPDREGFIFTVLIGSDKSFFFSSPNKQKKVSFNYKLRIKSQLSHEGSEQSFENFLNIYFAPVRKLYVLTKVGFSILKDNIADDTYYYNDYNLDGDLVEIEKKDWGIIPIDAQNYMIFRNRLCNFDPIVFQNDYLGNFSVKLKLDNIKGFNLDIRNENLFDYDKESKTQYSRIKMRSKFSYKFSFFKYFSIEPKYQITYINDNLFYYQGRKKGTLSTATNIVTDGVTTNYIYVHTPDDDYLRSYYSEQTKWDSYLNSIGIRFKYSTFFIKPVNFIVEFNYNMGKFYKGIEYVIGGRYGKSQSPINIDFIYLHKNVKFKETGQSGSYNKIMIGASRWINPY